MYRHPSRVALLSLRLRTFSLWCVSMRSHVQMDVHMWVVGRDEAFVSPR